MHLGIASFVGGIPPWNCHIWTAWANPVRTPCVLLPSSWTHNAQASRETAASAAADQLRRDQLALKQSKQLIPILAPASKGKPYKSPAAAHSTATAHANGTKTSALLNGGLPRKSSLESLGRMSSQVHVRFINSISSLLS